MSRDNKERGDKPEILVWFGLDLSGRVGGQTRPTGSGFGYPAILWLVALVHMIVEGLNKTHIVDNPILFHLILYLIILSYPILFYLILSYVVHLLILSYLILS